VAPINKYCCGMCSDGLMQQGVYSSNIAQRLHIPGLGHAVHCLGESASQLGMRGAAAMACSGDINRTVPLPDTPLATAQVICLPPGWGCTPHVPPTIPATPVTTTVTTPVTATLPLLPAGQQPARSPSASSVAGCGSIQSAHAQCVQQPH
jgi:hypothetical protein